MSSRSDRSIRQIAERAAEELDKLDSEDGHTRGSFMRWVTVSPRHIEETLTMVELNATLTSVLQREWASRSTDDAVAASHRTIGRYLERQSATRAKKQHWPGGIHYIVLFSNSGQEIFHDDADRQRFVDFLGIAQAGCNAEILCFCLGPRDVRLVVRVLNVPVGRLVQCVATHYARNYHAKYGTAGHLFQHPYRAYLLEGTTHLLDIVRHVHLAPLEMGVTEDLDAYRWSSHPVYLSLQKLDWLRQATVRELLAMRAEHWASSQAAPAESAALAAQVGIPTAAGAPRTGGMGSFDPSNFASAPASGDSASGSWAVPAVSVVSAVPDVSDGNTTAYDMEQLRYREFMSGLDGTSAEWEVAPPPSALHSDDQFFKWLRRDAGRPPATVTIDQVIQAVAKKMGVDRKRLLSTSQGRRLTRIRALIGRRVAKHVIATLTEMSPELHRDSASAYTAYVRYRASRPRLFRDLLTKILRHFRKRLLRKLRSKLPCKD